MNRSNLAGFDFWVLEFDKDGDPLPSVEEFLDEMPHENLTDLYIFSHGWNNDREAALDLYTRFFNEVRVVLDHPSVTRREGVNLAIGGLIWPSILFPGDTLATSEPGGAAGIKPPWTARSLESELPKAFPDARHQQLLRELISLLSVQQPSNCALIDFRDKLLKLISPPAEPSTQDSSEKIPPMSDDAWFAYLRQMGDLSTDTSSDGGAADFSGEFGRLWTGAKEILRVTTYWEMKNRAGVVGKRGLGPLIAKLHQAAPSLRIHLLGHSFGARLISYALAGLPASFIGANSPVKTLVLLQGAFSHFSFCTVLPFDSTRSGDLKDMAVRVDGPLIATFSRFDTAVGVAYPNASFLANQDSADVNDVMYRWEGMGCDGAQNPDAKVAPLQNLNTTYEFRPGQWLNLDGNSVIVSGGPPSGAHSDIVHPHTAWIALAAAQLVR